MKATNLYGSSTATMTVIVQTASTVNFTARPDEHHAGYDRHVHEHVDARWDGLPLDVWGR